MSAILKFDFQKRKQLRFSEVNYLNYTKTDPILHVTTTVSLKQVETRTSSGPIPHPLSFNAYTCGFCVHSWDCDRELRTHIPTHKEKTVMFG